ncbi:MAG: NAD(P)/FAD-dependent oxidoreductase [Paracoccaceae bacterium]|nr:NAD(P)/FAD-dependent oxidoreductase [Paracoccaceae bacterium]
MPSNKHDIAIVGAGVVGCALARRLTLDGASVIVLEKAYDVLDGASKGNSAILHTGFDAPSGSLELDCIKSGYNEYLEVSESLSLPILKSGALVLAWDSEQLKVLPKLIEKAHENGIFNVRPLDREEILRREPELSRELLGGFEVPGEYIIDPWASANAYIGQAVENGANLWRGVEVLSGNFEQNYWTLETSTEKVYSRYLINCGGLYGDLLDERLIKKKNFTITPRKGQFVIFDKAASSLVSSTVLPIPTATTKGVVICRTIFGNLLVGPTAEDQESRRNIATDSSTLVKLCKKGSTIIPKLENYDITSSYAGLRPATQYSDYQIHHKTEMAYLTVGGIRSTGLSAALGIANYVSKMLSEMGFQFSPQKNPKLPEVDKLSEYHERDWQIPGADGVVCHCEMVTKREIERVINGPIPPQTIQGLKRRTRVAMGRCQGFYCSAELAKITNGKLKIPLICNE